MREFEHTYEKWRKTLLRTNIYLVLFVFLIEVLMLFVLKKSNLITQPLPIYLRDFLIMPTIEDVLIIIVGYILLKRLPPDSGLINYIPSLQLSFICLVVASTHFIFSATLCVFCVPLFTTVIFSDRTITLRVGTLCYFFLALTLIKRMFSQYRLIDDRYFFTEALVSFVILTATIFICRVFIKFQEEKNDIIQQGHLSQLKMQDQLNKDPKTGLYGHLIFMNKLDQLVKLSEKTSNAIAVAIIDIDNFKKVNDTYGHLQGDRVILMLTDLMKKGCSENRFLSRFGGEEFAILFTGNEVNCAYEFLEKLRTAFEIQTHDFTDDVITVSIGMAAWKSGLSAEDLFNNADTAMYVSKKNGKNRTNVYEL